MISPLRILGIVSGSLVMMVAFLYYRGPKWRRNSFLYLFLLGLALLSVSIAPDLVNSISELLMFKDSQHGRILTLLTVSILGLWIVVMHFYGKIEKLKYNNEMLFRSVTFAESDRYKESVVSGLKPITILIPAYNEADNLRQLLPRLPKKLHGLDVSVLVVDDGSTDDTESVLRESGVVSVRHVVNRGQGAACRLGYSLMLQGKVRVGVTMDADNQHRPEDLPQLVAPVLNDGADLVIGSRRLGSGASSSFARSMGISLFSKVLSLVTAVRLTDCTSGYKAFSRRWIEEIDLREDQFQSTEVLISTVKKGLRICETPVTIVPRKFGESKKGTDFTYGYRVAKVIVKSWWH